MSPERLSTRGATASLRRGGPWRVIAAVIRLVGIFSTWRNLRVRTGALVERREALDGAQRALSEQAPGVLDARIVEPERGVVERLHVGAVRRVRLAVDLAPAEGAKDDAPCISREAADVVEVATPTRFMWRMVLSRRRSTAPRAAFRARSARAPVSPSAYVDVTCARRPALSASVQRPMKAGGVSASAKAAASTRCRSPTA